MSTLARRAMRRRLELHLTEMRKIESAIKNFGEREGTNLADHEASKDRASSKTTPPSNSPTGQKDDAAIPLAEAEMTSSPTQNTHTANRGTAPDTQKLPVKPEDVSLEILSRGTAPSLSTAHHAVVTSAAASKFVAYSCTVKHMHKGVKKNLRKIEDAHQKLMDERWRSMSARAQFEQRCRHLIRLNWTVEEAPNKLEKSSLCHACTPEDMVWDDMVQVEARRSAEGYAYRRDELGRRVTHL
ncbi:hypothetical protein GQ53DRAFT_460859 [Thozetella sp. PMI_491]|nr:hypothetical protein GQ53DRAFT_460859 [Thozetella sp. PMI_491]